MIRDCLGEDTTTGILLGVNTYDSRGLRIKAYKRVPPFLEVSLPNGGESYALGSAQTIHWNGSSLSGTVNLELLVNGEVAGTIAENLPSSQTSCEWEVGKLSTGAWIDPGSDFKIRVTALGVPNRFETVYSIYGSDGKLLSEYNETGTCTRDYLYLGGKLLAEFQPVTNKYYYYTSDQINSTRIVTDSTGRLVYSRQYDPYGGILSTESKVYVPKPGFSGKERESVSELDYFGARYYDHRTFRFNALDPISNSTGATKSPQLWNLYIYCRNNPITFLDPNGKNEILIWELITKAFAITFPYISAACVVYNAAGGATTQASGIERGAWIFSDGSHELWPATSWLKNKTVIPMPSKSDVVASVHNHPNNITTPQPNDHDKAIRNRSSYHRGKPMMTVSNEGIFAYDTAREDKMNQIYQVLSGKNFRQVYRLFKENNQ